MAGKRIHIRNKLHLSRARCGPANTARKRDHQTAMPAAFTETDAEALTAILAEVFQNAQ